MNIQKFKQVYLSVISESVGPEVPKTYTPKTEGVVPFPKNLTLATLIDIKFKPFDKDDYETFAGVESNYPLIAEYSGHIFIIDGDIIEVFDEDASEPVARFKLSKNLLESVEEAEIGYNTVDAETAQEIVDRYDKDEQFQEIMDDYPELESMWRKTAKRYGLTDEEEIVAQLIDDLSDIIEAERRRS